MSRALMLGVALCCVAPATNAAVCVVPGAAHPTIQRAVDDDACTSIAVAAGSFPESILIQRSLALEGAGSSLSALSGRVEISGAVSAAFSGVTIGNGCVEPGLRILGGAAVSTSDVVIGSALLSCPAFPDRLFGNGFE